MDFERRDFLIKFIGVDEASVVSARLIMTPIALAPNLDALMVQLKQRGASIAEETKLLRAIMDADDTFTVARNRYAPLWYHDRDFEADSPIPRFTPCRR